MYRVIQYLIRKLLDVVDISQEGYVVPALFTSFMMSSKVPIYYIKCDFFDSEMEDTVNRETILSRRL